MQMITNIHPRPARRTNRCTIWACRMLLAASAALLPSRAMASPPEPGRNKADLGPGCAPERPAIAHYAGGVAAHETDKARTNLIPCLVPTKWRTSEVGMVVTNRGTVLVQPGVGTPPTGLPLGILRSTDRGANWNFMLLPFGPNAPPFLLPFDGNMGIDRQTGRAFSMTPGYKNLSPTIPPQTSRVVFSDDDGRTWSEGGAPLMRFDSGNADSVKIFTGPPTKKSKHLMRGYPNVAYNCSGHKPLRCQKSLDGGMTWGPAVDMPFPPELAPIQGPLNDCSNFGLNGVVGTDGTVYVGYTPCNRPYVAISRDEGDSWQAVRVADVETIGWGMLAIDIDKGGTLYAAWVAAADRLPYLSHSTAAGLRWSPPLMIGAPGINEAALPRMVNGAEGQVAVAYFATKNSPGAPFPAPCPGFATNCVAWQSVTWNTYITETFNALDRHPLLWSAALADPARPTWYGCSPSSLGVIRLDESAPFKSGPGFTGGCSPTAGGIAVGGRQDYFGMDMARDNTPWVGFGQSCPKGLPVPGNSSCPSTLSGAPEDASWALVGRLVQVRDEAERHAEDRGR
jgi:hypothetical protein